MFADAPRSSLLEIGHLLTGRHRKNPGVSKLVEIGKKKLKEQNKIWNYILFIGVPAVLGIYKFVKDSIDNTSSFMDSAFDVIKAPLDVFTGAIDTFKSLFESFTDNSADSAKPKPTTATQAASSPNSTVAIDHSGPSPVPFVPKSDAATKDLLYRTGREQHVDKYLLQTIAQIESSMNPSAKNSTTGATGLYQFLPSTWNELVTKNYKDLGYTSSDINDSQKQAVVASRWFNDIGDLLQKTLGRPPSPTEIYTAHFLGKSGGLKFIKALHDTPNAIAANYFQAAAKANPAIFYEDRGRGKAQTFQGVFNTLYNKVSPVYDVFSAEGGDAPPPRPIAVASPSTTTPTAAATPVKQSVASASSATETPPSLPPSYRGETGRKMDKVDAVATKPVPDAGPQQGPMMAQNSEPLQSTSYFRDKSGRAVALQGS